MTTEFFLAIALLCPQENNLRVIEMVDTRPSIQEDCEVREQSDRLRARYLKPRTDGCEEILLCINLSWPIK